MRRGIAVTTTVIASLAGLLPVAATYAADTTQPESSQAAAWFRVQPVADGVWRIYDDRGAGNAYVVTGRKRALLIDTGTGLADLAAAVRRITRLPLTVVVTHGHYDHVGGNFQFAMVSAHPDDFDMTLRSASAEGRVERVKRIVAESPVLESQVLKDGGGFDRISLVAVRGGHVFDLGGRKLEVIATPGHTRGSICLLDKTHKLLFTGDTTNSLVWLFLKDCLPLEVYLRTLQALNQRASEYTTVLPGHNEPLDAAFIAEQIGCVESILSGACKGEPYANRISTSALVCAYKRAQVAFDPENLRTKP